MFRCPGSTLLTYYLPRLSTFSLFRFRGSPLTDRHRPASSPALHWLAAHTPNVPAENRRAGRASHPRRLSGATAHPDDGDGYDSDGHADGNDPTGAGGPAGAAQAPQVHRLEWRRPTGQHHPNLCSNKRTAGPKPEPIRTLT